MAGNPETIKALVGPLGDGTEIVVYNLPERKLVQIEYGEMYDRPSLRNAEALDAVRVLFGGVRVSEVEGESRSGCESCDFGSCYGNTITIEGATKNLDMSGEVYDKR